MSTEKAIKKTEAKTIEPKKCRNHFKLHDKCNRFYRKELERFRQKDIETDDWYWIFSKLDPAPDDGLVHCFDLSQLALDATWDLADSQLLQLRLMFSRASVNSSLFMPHMVMTSSIETWLTENWKVDHAYLIRFRISDMKLTSLELNKTGTSQVGAIPKAQR